MEDSYRRNLKKFEDDEVQIVLDSTATLLRRHNVGGTMCPRCSNDEPAAFSVTGIDDLGFITEVRCEKCRPKLRLSTICHNSRYRYEPIEDPSTLSAGDHIAWHRPYLIWHHALVMKNHRDRREITIHEYNHCNGGCCSYAVIETTMSYDKCVFHCIYRRTYSTG